MRVDMNHGSECLKEGFEGRPKNCGNINLNQKSVWL
jgi:hypothetical protein